MKTKQIFSLFLALALVFGMVGAIPVPAKAAEAAATTKVLADELEGYNRITATDFESLSNQRMGESFTLANAGKTQYVGNYNGKNYLDVDVNFGEANTAHYLRYFGDAAKTSIYVGAFTLRLFADQNGVNHIEFGYQDVDTKLDTVVPTKTVVAADYGVAGANTDFNIKLLTDIRQSAEDATKDVIAYQFWINDIFVCEGSFEETSHDRMGLCAQIPVGKNLTIKTPAEPEDWQKAFEGYTRVTLEDYSFTLDGTGNTTLANGANATYKGAADMNKTYVDMDVNYNGNVHYSNFRIRFFSSDTWKDSYCLSWETASQLIITRYDNAKNHTILARVKNIADFGISGPSDWFNMKYKIDFTPNGTDATKQTAKIQLWLNNKLAWESEIEEVNAAANRNKIYVTSNGGTISARVPEKNVEDELKGYTPITLDEYDCNMNIRGEISIANGGSVNALVSSFDKTYLDVDVNFSGVVGKGSANMRYQSSGKWTDSYVLGWNSDGTSLHFFRYGADSKTTDFVANIPAADYSIASASDWFNVKIRTDITGEGTTSQTAHIQLWLNDKLAWEGDSVETRANASRAAIFCSISGSKTVMLRSPRILEDELAGYTRVTIEDVNGLGAARTQAGTKYASGKSGEYVGKSFDKTYLDMDVQTTAGCFLTYLMSENTFWGSDRYQFELTGTNLKITPVYSGSAKTAVTLGMASVGYEEGTMFNLKVRTDIEPAGEGQKVIMQFWCNDKYLTKLTFEESAVRTAKYMGIRGTANATYVRTPMTDVVREDVAYNLSDGAYLLTGADYFYVNGKKMPSGTVLAAPNDYIVERVVDGKIADSKRVSLYYMGDVNLDGKAFVAGDPVYMDSHALLGIVNYGTPMKAAQYAADLNNDGKVTEADYDLLVLIRSDVSKKDEILGQYYTDAQSYTYLGGKDVMPIGGFYGPYSDATLTDGIFELIANSGINLITYSGIDAASDANRLQQSLALAEKYGIGMFVTDSGLNTVTKDENGDVTGHKTVTTAEELAALMATYGAYDSFLGITIVDEPKGSANWANDTHNNPTLDTAFSNTNYKRYQYYEALAEALKSYANVTGYINLHGSQSVDMGEFYEYASQIGEDVDVLSFDTYLYFEDQTYPILARRRLSSYLESLDTIRQVGLEQGKPFWSYVQAGSDYRQNAEGNDIATEGYYTEADTLWIVNTSLAYGAKGIQYFPLLQPEYFSLDNTKESGHDYDRNGLIGFNNEANRNYAMVQKANNQIQAIDHVLMNATSTGVVVTGTAQTDVALSASERGHSFTGIISGTQMLNKVTSGNAGAMVGTFDYQGYEAYYVVNYDRTEGASQNITLSLNQNAKYHVIANAVKSTGEGSEIALSVPSGEGVLVVLETKHTHTYGDWTVTKPATVSETGLKQQACACGDVITEEIPCLANVDSWSLTLGDDLSVNFYVDIHEDIADTAKVVVSVAGKEYTYDPADEITVNVAAAQMNDEITVQIVDGDDASVVKTYTVLQYAQYVLSQQSMSQYHQLVKEMLNYGAWAQTQFGYNADNLVNENIDGVAAEEVPNDAAANMAVSGRVDGIRYYGATLVLRNKIAVRYYFTVTGDINSYTFKVNGEEVDYGYKGGLYYVEVADINPQELDDAITVTVNDTLSVSYSPMNYIVRMSQNGTDTVKGLVKALYNYHLAAEAICPDAE